MTFIQGVDVASYQPADFPTKGIAFAFIKVSQGTSYTNPKVDEQIADAVRGKCAVGLYHFMQPGDSILAQVAYFKSRNKVKPGHIIAVDWESLNGAWPSSNDKDAMIRGLKVAYPKNRVGLYTDLDGWKTRDTSGYCGDFLWIADIVEAGKPRITHPWVFHQYGQNANGDQDVANFQTQAALIAWANALETPPPVNAPTVPTPEYRAVLLNDVFPTPDGHSDSGGTGQWTLQTFLASMYSEIADCKAMLTEIVAEINASKGAGQ